MITRIQKRHNHIPRARARRSGSIHCIFPREKSTKNILHPKLHGANPATKARSTDPPPVFFETREEGFQKRSFCTDRINIYTLKKKSIAILIFWIITIYSVGSYKEKKSFVTKKSNTISARCTSEKIVTKTSPCQKPFSLSNTCETRNPLECPGPIA